MASVSTSRCRRSRGFARALIVLLAAASIFAGPASADGPPRKAEVRKRGIRGLSLRLDERRLAPRVSLELESLSAFGRATQPGVGLDSHVMWEEMTDHVRGRAKSVTRRALRDHLLRAVRLDRGIDTVRDSLGGGASARGNLDFHFGVHSMLPEVGLSYKLRSGAAMGLTVGAEGDVGLRFRADRFERADFAADFDGEDTFRVRALLSF